jgi:hypothetical protein
MNIKRAVGFGAMLWIAAFVSISILMFAPWFKESASRYQIAWILLEIPVVLLLAKWYFKMNIPTVKKGFLLGVIGLITSSVLDLIITIPLFLAPNTDTPIGDFFFDWKMLVGFGLVLVLTTYAGYEFDGPIGAVKETVSEEAK